MYFLPYPLKLFRNLRYLTTSKFLLIFSFFCFYLLISSSLLLMTVIRGLK